MKKFIYLLAFVLPIIAVGQLQSSGPISISDIRDEQGKTGPYSIGDGRIDYGLTGETAFSDFYGLSGQCNTVTTITSWYDNGGSGWGSSSSACSGGGSETTIYSSGGATPSNGDILYTDSFGCNVKIGGGSWFKIRVSATFYRFQVSSLGVISNVSTC